MLDPELLTFIRGSFRSVWALELLLLLRKGAPASFGPEQMARELRATPTLVATCTEQLQVIGVLSCEAGNCRYAPVSPVLADLCDALERAYRERPVAVINAIVSTPDDRLKNFADAFRFKEKDE